MLLLSSIGSQPWERSILLQNPSKTITYNNKSLQKMSTENENLVQTYMESCLSKNSKQQYSSRLRHFEDWVSKMYPQYCNEDNSVDYNSFWGKIFWWRFSGISAKSGKLMRRMRKLHSLTFSRLSCSHLLMFLVVGSHFYFNWSWKTENFQKLPQISRVA